MQPSIEVFWYDYLRLSGGLSEITALENSARCIEPKVESLIEKKVRLLFKQRRISASAKKLIIAVPSFPFEDFTGDVTAEVKSYYLFTSTLDRYGLQLSLVGKRDFLRQRLPLKPLEIFASKTNCSADMMPCR